MKYYFIISVATAVCFLSHMATAPVQANPGFSISMNGASVFQNDGFESDTVGEVPIVTTIGSWNITELGDDVRARVTDEAPDAASGDNFVDMYDPRTGVAGHPFAEAVLRSLASSNDQVTAKFGLYVDSEDNTGTGSLFCNFMTVAGTTEPYQFGANFLKIGFQNGDFLTETGIDLTGIGETDLILGWYDGTQYHNVTSDGENMYMSPDTWHAIELNATLSSGWTITVDGVISDLAVWRDGHQGGDYIESLMLGGASANPTHFYLDGSFMPVERIPGDANEDGAVDVSDLGILATNYNAGSELTWGQGDFTGDGLVDVSDLGVLATNYGVGANAQATPEPGTSALLLVMSACIACLPVRRRD